MKAEPMRKPADTSARHVDGDSKNTDAKYSFYGLNLVEAIDQLKRAGYFNRGSRSITLAAATEIRSPQIESQPGNQTGHGLFSGLTPRGDAQRFQLSV